MKAPTARTAEVGQEVPIVEFLEDSYFVLVPGLWTRGPGDRGYLFNPPSTARNPHGIILEGNLSPHFYFYTTLNELERQPDSDWRFKWFWSAAFTFELRVRMTSDYSWPVRPASFMPHPFLDWQVYLVQRSSPRSFWLNEIRFTPWLHHSNGQQECTFQIGHRDDVPSDPCAPVDPDAPPIDDLNFRAGEFSANALVLAAHSAFVRTNARYEEIFRASGGLEWEIYPVGYLVGSIKPLQQHMFGMHIVRLDLSVGADPVAWRRGELFHDTRAPSSVSPFEGPLRLRLLGEVAVDRWLTGSGPPDVPVARGSVELAYLPRGLSGLGLFVKGVAGRDNHNVLYLRGNTYQLDLGIFWRQSYRPTYRFLMAPPTGTPGSSLW